MCWIAGTDRFGRIKIGVGKPEAAVRGEKPTGGAETAGFVLSQFNQVGPICSPWISPFFFKGNACSGIFSLCRTNVSFYLGSRRRTKTRNTLLGPQLIVVLPKRRSLTRRIVLPPKWAICFQRTSIVAWRLPWIAEMAAKKLTIQELEGKKRKKKKIDLVKLEKSKEV